MLFWLFLIFFGVGIVLIILDKVVCKYDDTLAFIGMILSLFTGVCLIFSFVVFLNTFGCLNANIAKYEERYKAITYKVESDVCRDDFGLLSKEVIDEVQEWNEDITFKKKIAHNFWIGIYNSDAYDKFDIIDYEKYGENK